MALNNPITLNNDNISSYTEVLNNLIKNSDKKPVLFVIKADWCGYCQMFTENAWAEFKKKTTASQRVQIVEIDDGALGWLKTHHEQLHKILLIEPPKVYFPQVYMLDNKKKHAFQPNYTPKKRGEPNVAFDALNAWVDRFVSHRKAPRINKVVKGGSKPLSHKAKNNKSKSKVTLKEQIDNAFKKLFLR
jgi:thiol-disulfide isomerase/thioredoxin